MQRRTLGLQNIPLSLTYPEDLGLHKHSRGSHQSKHKPCNSSPESNESSLVAPCYEFNEFPWEKRIFISVDPGLRNCFMTVMEFTREKDDFVLKRLEFLQRLQVLNFDNVESSLRSSQGKQFYSYICGTVIDDVKDLFIHQESEILQQEISYDTKYIVVIEKQMEEPYITIEKALVCAFHIGLQKADFEIHTVCPAQAARYYGTTIKQIGSREVKKEISKKVVSEFLGIDVNDHLADTILNWAYIDLFKPYFGEYFKDAILSHRHPDVGVQSGNRNQFKRNLRTKIKESRIRRTGKS